MRKQCNTIHHRHCKYFFCYETMSRIVNFRIRNFAMRKNLVSVFFTIIIGFLPFGAIAGDLTVRTKIVGLRGYVNGAYFVTLATNAMTASALFPTCTTVYKVNNLQPGKNVVIASAMSAHAQGQDVQIEISPLGCSGFATLITSIFVY